jgi:hypothetical protein
VEKSCFVSLFTAKNTKRAVVTLGYQKRNFARGEFSRHREWVLLPVAEVDGESVVRHGIVPSLTYN